MRKHLAFGIRTTQKGNVEKAYFWKLVSSYFGLGVVPNSNMDQVVGHGTLDSMDNYVQLFSSNENSIEVAMLLLLVVPLLSVAGITILILEILMDRQESYQIRSYVIHMSVSFIYLWVIKPFLLNNPRPAYWCGSWFEMGLGEFNLNLFHLCQGILLVFGSLIFYSKMTVSRVGLFSIAAYTPVLFIICFSNNDLVVAGGIIGAWVLILLIVVADLERQLWRTLFYVSSIYIIILVLANIVNYYIVVEDSLPEWTGPVLFITMMGLYLVQADLCLFTWRFMLPIVRSLSGSAFIELLVTTSITNVVILVRAFPYLLGTPWCVVIMTGVGLMTVIGGLRLSTSIKNIHMLVYVQSKILLGTVIVIFGNLEMFILFGVWIYLYLLLVFIPFLAIIRQFLYRDKTGISSIEEPVPFDRRGTSYWRFEYWCLYGTLLLLLVLPYVVLSVELLNRGNEAGGGVTLILSTMILISQCAVFCVIVKRGVDGKALPSPRHPVYQTMSTRKFLFLIITILILIVSIGVFFL